MIKNVEANQSVVVAWDTIFSPVLPGELSYVILPGRLRLIRTVDGVEDYIGELYSDDAARLDATGRMLCGF